MFSIAVLVAACGSPPRSTPRPSTPPLPTTEPPKAVLLVLAGPNTGALSVYRLDFVNHNITKLTDPPPNHIGASTIGGAGKWVVVADASKDNKDRLYTLAEDGHLVPITDSPAVGGQRPQVRDDGLVLYSLPIAHVIVPHQVINYTGEIHEYNLVTHADRVVVTSPNDLGVDGWGPNGSFVYTVYAYSPTRTTLVIHSADGSERRLPTVNDNIEATTSTPNAPGIAVTIKGDTHIVDPTTMMYGKTLPHWIALTWSPDGQTLLLARTDQFRLGIWHVGDPEPRSFGSFTGGSGIIEGAVWME